MLLLKKKKVNFNPICTDTKWPLKHNEWKEQGPVECANMKTKISIHKGEANYGWGSRADFPFMMYPFAPFENFAEHGCTSCSKNELVLTF